MQPLPICVVFLSVQPDETAVRQRYLVLRLAPLRCRGLAIAPGERHDTTRSNIELPPHREGLIAPPSPFAPGSIGPRAFGNLMEAEICQTVVLEFQDARKPLHILWGVDRLSYLVLMPAIVEERAVRQVPLLTTGPAHNLARVDIECVFL